MIRTDKIGYAKRAAQDDCPNAILYPIIETITGQPNAATKKLQQAALNWAGKASQLVTIDNVPRAGFEIVTARSSRSLTDKKVVLVKDPAGFRVEITSANVIELVRNASINCGVIDQECVWFREGVTNILIPVNSDLYDSAEEKAVADTKLTPIKNRATIVVSGGRCTVTIPKATVNVGIQLVTSSRDSAFYSTRTQTVHHSATVPCTGMLVFSAYVADAENCTVSELIAALRAKTASHFYPKLQKSVSITASDKVIDLAADEVRQLTDCITSVSSIEVTSWKREAYSGVQTYDAYNQILTSVNASYSSPPPATGIISGSSPRVARVGPHTITFG